MMVVKGELGRVLTLLRNKIRERGFTQLEVQRELGWGRSYLSQLLTQQKALRVEQVLLILRVVGVDAGAFFGELFPPPGGASAAGRSAMASAAAPSRSWGSRAEPAKSFDPDSDSRDRRSLNELSFLVHGLVELLADKGIIDLDDLTSTVRGSEPELSVAPPDAR